jgi:hypothetical protein
MMNELAVLWWVYGICLTELDKAKKGKNTLFLNTLRETLTLFGEDPSDYVDGKKGKGDKVSIEAMKKRFMVFKNHTFKKAIEIPKTFYDREKPTGLCWLLCMTHTIFHKPLERVSRELKREKAKKKIKLLMEKYGIFSDEIFPNASPLASPTMNLTASLLGAGSTHRKEEKYPSTPTKKLIEQILKRQVEIDGQLQELKDI